MVPFKFSLGQRTIKVQGYKWPGMVVSCFRNLSGQRRYVVECTLPGVQGALHIYNEDQLESDHENGNDPDRRQQG